MVSRQHTHLVRWVIRASGIIKAARCTLKMHPINSGTEGWALARVDQISFTTNDCKFITTIDCFVSKNTIHTIIKTTLRARRERENVCCMRAWVDASRQWKSNTEPSRFERVCCNLQLIIPPTVLYWSYLKGGSIFIKMKTGLRLRVIEQTLRCLDGSPRIHHSKTTKNITYIPQPQDHSDHFILLRSPHTVCTMQSTPT